MSRRARFRSLQEDRKSTVDAIVRYTGCSRTRAEGSAERLSRWSDFVRDLLPEQAPWDKQAEFIDDYVTRRLILRKSRGVGFSHACAVKGLGKAMARPGYGRVFVSLNKTDAQRKIGYARELYERVAERMPLPGLMDGGSRSELRFTNGSWLRAMYDPRGQHGCDIDLDEFAHMQAAHAIFNSVNPIFARGGQLTIGSSVTSATSFFSQIYTGAEGRFGDSVFKRDEWYWWDCPHFCRDVATARQVAPSMDTEQRVRTFGTRMLWELFLASLIEDFQMEMEGREADEADALLSWELIKRCTPTGPNTIEEKDLDELERVAAGRRICAGYDVGRHHDTSELSALVDPVEGGKHVREEAQIRLEKTPFPEQREFLNRFMAIPNTFIAIDQTGMGIQLAEELESLFGEDRVCKVNFGANIPTAGALQTETAPAKPVMAQWIRTYMERDRVRFQAGADRNYQMHSIKRFVTREGRLQYLVDEDKAAVVGGKRRRHHGDVFWARALACYMHALVIGTDTDLLYI